MLLIEQFVTQGQLIENLDVKNNDAILCRAKYQICSIGEKNRNKRVYGAEVWEKVLGDQDIQLKLKNRSLFCHAEHPTTTQSNTEKIAGIVTEIVVDQQSNKVFAIMEVLDTPYGKIIETLLKANCGIGVSTRADGELEEALDETGETYSRVIPESYRFVTVDWTADPSTYGSELPLTVERDLVGTVRDGLDSRKVDRQFATVMLEKMKSPEAIALLETVKNDKDHKDCTCKPSERTCSTGCNHTSEVKEQKLRKSRRVVLQETQPIANAVDQAHENPLAIWWYDLTSKTLKYTPYRKGLQHNLDQALDKQYVRGRVIKDKATGKNVIVAWIYWDAQNPRNLSQDDIQTITKEVQTHLDDFVAYFVDEYGEDLTEKKVEDVHFDNLKEYVVKVGSEWEVKSHEGKSLGKYNTKEEAVKRLKQIEYFKHNVDERSVRVVEFEFETEDGKPYTAEVVVSVGSEHYGADADGNRGVSQSYMEEQSVKVLDSNNKPVTITAEMRQIIDEYLEDVDLNESKNENFNAMVKFLTDNKDQYKGKVEAIKLLVETFKVTEDKAKEVFEKKTTIIQPIKETINFEVKIKELETLNNVVTEVYDKRVAELKQQLEETKQEVASLKLLNEASKSEIKKLTEEVQSLEVTVTEKNKTLRENQSLLDEKTNTILDLKEQHNKELIKVYVGSKINQLGLKLHPNLLTLLENCGTVKEVDQMVIKVQDEIREGLSQSGSLSEIKIGTEPMKKDPVRENIDNKVSHVMKGLGI